MPIDHKRIVELAIANLEGEKSRIDAELAELRTQLGGTKPASTAQAASTAKAKTATIAKRGAKFVRTAAQKAKTAATMKALWAKVYKAGFNNIRDYQASLKKG